MAAPAIGARRRRFVLQMPIETPDGFGGVIRTYQPGPQLWGAIEMIAEAERIRAAQPEGVATHRVTLAFRDGVTGLMRLTCGVRSFHIKAASDLDGARRSLVCLVEEVTP